MDSFSTIKYQWFSMQSNEVEYQYIENTSKNTFMMRVNQRYTLTTTFEQQLQDHPIYIKE